MFPSSSFFGWRSSSMVSALIWAISFPAPVARSQTPSPGNPAPAGAQAGFDVETLAISAPEIAELLGYDFHGYRWQFSTPTYVRVKIWDDTGDDKTPEHPEDGAEANQTLDLEGAQSEVSLRLVYKKAEDSPPDDHADRFKRTHLEFHLTLSGKNAAKGFPDGTNKELIPEVAALMPRALAEQANYESLSGSTESMSLDRRSNESIAMVWQHSSGDIENALDALKGEFGDLAKPGALENIAALKAKWQAESEAKMFAKPIRVFYFKAETRAQTPKSEPAGKFGRVKGRAVYVVSLACSHTPFPSEQDAPGETATPGAKASPPPAPLQSPAPEP